MPTSNAPCPICRKSAAPRAVNAASPFCGERCRLVDLGKWLNGGYRVPTDEVLEGLEGASEQASEREPS